MTPFLQAAWSLVLRDYRVRFRRTLLGIVWFLLPLFTLAGMALLMGRNLGIYPEGQSRNYLIQLLIGLILWQLLADTWLEPMRLARRANQIFRSVVFDSRILLAAGALSALVAFTLKIPVLFAAMVWFNIPITSSIISLPFAICSLVAIGMAMACFTLPLSLALLDVRYALPFFQYALLLATPIFYQAPDAGPVAWLNRNNPFSYLIPPIRDMLLGGALDVLTLLVQFALALCFLVVGLRYYQSKIRLAVAYIGH